MKLAVFSAHGYDRTFFEAENAQFGHELVFFEAGLDARTAPLAVGFDGVCVFVNDRLDAPTLAALAAGGVRFIALRCAGFNNVDLKAAAASNLRVARVPAYSPHAVAEHALALILTLNRKTHKAYNRVREGNFSLDGLTGFDLYGRTVGVVGTGLIGAVFAGLMLGVGCKTLAHDIKPDAELQRRGVEYVPLDTLYRRSDIISLHCPLTPATQHLINARALELMRDGVMLINTGRGGLIDTRAVVDALKSRRVGALGLDVYEQEEGLFFSDHSGEVLLDDLIARLLTFPNVLITGHQAFFTEDALRQIAIVTLSNAREFESGATLSHEVRA
jgi:D-lactate dehydrogenase